MSESKSNGNVPPDMLGAHVTLNLNLPMGDGKGGVGFPKLEGTLREDLGGAILLAHKLKTGEPARVELVPKSNVFSIVKTSTILAG